MVDLNDISRDDGAKIFVSLGDDSGAGTSATREPCQFKIKGRDPEQNFEDTLYGPMSTLAIGAAITAYDEPNVEWHDMVACRVSETWLGPDSELILEAKDDVATADILDESCCCIHIPITLRNVDTNMRYTRMLHRYDFTNLGTAATDTGQITLTTTGYTELGYFPIPKRYEVCLGWDADL